MLRHRFAAAVFGVVLGLFWVVEAQGQVIMGCVHERTGILRAVDSAEDCRSNEDFVAWNAIGPAGPRGAEGPEGPVGPRGPSNALGSFQDELWRELNTCTTPITSPECDVLTLDLGPGLWLVFGKTTLSNATSSFLPLRICQLASDSAEIDQAAMDLQPTPSNVSIGLMGLLDAGTGTTVHLRCQEGPGEDTTAYDSKIIAIQVEAFTNIGG